MHTFENRSHAGSTGIDLKDVRVNLDPRQAPLKLKSPKILATTDKE